MKSRPNLELWGMRLAALMLLVAVLGMVTLKKLAIVQIAELTAGRVYDVLGTLLLLALLLERSLEVFVTAWRGPEADRLRLTVDNQIRSVRNLEVLPAAERTTRTNEITAAQDRLHTAESRELDYKAVTQRNTLGAAVVLGSLISAVGFRSLGRLVESESLASLSPWQQTTFAVVDVMLTGSVIAGGSEGIHKIINAMIRFFDLTSKRLRGPN